MRFVCAFFLAGNLCALAQADQAVRGGPVRGANVDVPGTLIIAGGGKVHAILDHFAEVAGGKQARIVVIPTASIRADRPELQTAYAYWKMQGIAVEVLHTSDRGRANDPKFIAPLRTATGVWIGGGDQSRLVASYKGTLVEKELHRLLGEGKVIGGTSAGAAVMSSIMIVGGNPVAQIGTGFGFLQRIVVDQHFQNRNRLNRLLGVLDQHRNHLGLGIDEQTAVVVRGRTITVVGDANVSVCSCLGEDKREVRLLQPGDVIDLLDIYQMLIGEAGGD